LSADELIGAFHEWSLRDNGDSTCPLSGVNDTGVIAAIPDGRCASPEMNFPEVTKD
jgi:hypothetical protein